MDWKGKIMLLVVSLLAGSCVPSWAQRQREAYEKGVAKFQARYDREQKQREAEARRYRLEREAKERRIAEEYKAAEQRRVDEYKSAVAACPNTGIPEGTYETEEGSDTWMRLEVTGSGCAAWEAFRRDHVEYTQEITDRRGTYDREYRRYVDCTERGLAKVSEQGVVAARTMFEGRGCNQFWMDQGDRTFSLLSARASWKVRSGGEPRVTIVARGGRVVLRRTSLEVEMHDGVSSKLWVEARYKRSVAQERTSIIWGR